MLKSKLKFPAKRQKVSAFSLQPSAFASAGAGVTRLGSGTRQGLLTSSLALPSIVNRKLKIANGFTLVEILVVVVLLSFIILALMTVFNATQTAFRASLTQTDVMEGGRGVMGLMKGDFESMTPSFGVSNGAVNFSVSTNSWQYQSNAAPLVQSLIGSSGYQRTNVLENFFILTRQNTTWTGTGYFVDTASTNYLNPLYRFSISTNFQAASPAMLYTNFLNTPVANMSHLMDGVVHLTVRAYDINGRWMTNLVTVYGPNPGYTIPGFTTNRNTLFFPPTLGEVGFYMYSNTVPAAVEVRIGVLEDRTIQRAESLPNFSPSWAQSNFLAQQAGKVHLFRQRFPIRNVDPSAYQ
jgi:prepilin-type N-terminal cleavage/methylation domain-containing protein